MRRESYQRVEQVFEAAADLPEADREAFLEHACGGDEDLLRKVQRLFSAEKHAEFLDQPLIRPPNHLKDRIPGRSTAATENSSVGRGLRVFLTSASPDVALFHSTARRVAEDMGFEPLEREDSDSESSGGDSVAAVARRVAGCDLVAAVVGRQAGDVPDTSLGGDRIHPWLYWELRSAFECEKPVVVFLADSSLSPDDSTLTETPQSRAAMDELRAELRRFATPFATAGSGERISADTLTAFQRQVREHLPIAEPVPKGSAPIQTITGPVDGLSTRAFHGATATVDTPWPEAPYPLQHPYAHPELLAGRDKDIDSLSRLLRRPVPILALLAVSGIGKSSLLIAGLLPRLRRDGWAVALDRRPAEPGLPIRLLVDLGYTGSRPKTSFDVDPAERPEIDVRRFVDRLARLGADSGQPPLLVIDQVEELFRVPDAGAPNPSGRARAVLGLLLAATAKRLPGTAGPLCRWLLACRHEHHGELARWLSDVLVDARREGFQIPDALPHDVSRPSRFHSMVLAPLGTLESEVEDPLTEVSRVFQEVIEKPLQAQTAEAGPARYPWQFAAGDAARLARAFAEARLERAGAPLVPELQAVLSRLLSRAEQPAQAPVTLNVPQDPKELIEHALEHHLRHALDLAFPESLEKQGRIWRGRALLVLRELAGSSDGIGRMPKATLTRIMGSSGRHRWDKLTTSPARLVILERFEDQWVYVLAHNGLAGAVTRLFDESPSTESGADLELLELRRYVALRTALFEAGDLDSASRVHTADFRRIAAESELLIWGRDRSRWWASVNRRRKDRRRRRVLGALGVVLTAAIALAIAHDRFKRWSGELARVEQVAIGPPEMAFGILSEAPATAPDDANRILAAWRRRPNPFDVFARGLGAFPAGAERAEAVVRAGTRGLSILEQSPRDPELIASLLWALDFFAVDPPETAEPARRLRQAVLSILYAHHPPPPLPAADDPDWVWIPAGSSWIGTASDEGRDQRRMLDERPRHQVTASGFRIQIHEVTRAEYSRFKGSEDLEQEELDLPQGSIDWFQAYTYAAWLGGRLPTEQEWEYAARAGCAYRWCRRDGTEASLEEVAWGAPQATVPALPKPVMQLEPNPWGLYDVLGNVGEWSANWQGAYPQGLEVDPVGPTSHEKDHKSWRGGTIQSDEDWLVVNGRGVIEPSASHPLLGFRVVIPVSWNGREPKGQDHPEP